MTASSFVLVGSYPAEASKIALFHINFKIGLISHSNGLSVIASIAR